MTKITTNCFNALQTSTSFAGTGRFIISLNQERDTAPNVPVQLTHREIEQLGRLINGFGIVGSQILYWSTPDLYHRAYSLLQKIRNKEQPLLQKLDEIAQSSKDQGPLQLIETLSFLPNDAAQSLLMARRCLAASAFLGHCIVVYSRIEATLAEATQGKSMH